MLKADLKNSTYFAQILNLADKTVVMDQLKKKKKKGKKGCVVGVK